MSFHRIAILVNTIPRNHAVQNCTMIKRQGMDEERAQQTRLGEMCQVISKLLFFDDEEMLII